MTKIHVLEFVGRLKHTFKDQRQRVTWLLGAGCSASSGIPTAGGMVRAWARELHAMQGARAGSFDDWVKTEFDTYSDEQAGRFYAKVFHRRHPSPLERQRAIEMFCSKARPGYGYATFAQILSHGDFGRLCNTVLTTNFDDLVADALYLHGALDARPQVIAHEAVTHFARVSSPRPTVVKLHGDAHLDPKNTETETRELPGTVCLHLYPFLNDSALIFLGYSGGDESIAAFFCGLPPPALAPQIYWIGSSPPGSKRLAEWFIERGALHVEHQDFDLLMHLLRGALEIAHPKLDERMKEIDQQYHQRRVELEKEAGGVSDPEEKAALEKASKATEGSLSGIWAVLAKARRQEVDNPDAAEKSYEEALKVDDKNSVALNNYAVFLETVRKDMGRAEAYYRRAIETDPKFATALTNYARFLQDVRKDMSRAERHYQRAIEVDPKYPVAIANYARFLRFVRKDMDEAEAHYQRAVEADPKYARGLGGYADFLETVRKDMDGAELHYRRAIEADPKDATVLNNFALFLERGRKDMDGAEVHYQRATEVNRKNAAVLTNYANFLKFHRKSADRAEAFYQRAIEAEEKEASARINYAALLGARGDFVALCAQLSKADFGSIEPRFEARFQARFHFIRYAHLADARGEALHALYGVLPGAEPSPHFDPAGNVERARADGHPDVPLLEDLARVLKGEASIEVLEGHPSWLAAGGEQISNSTSSSPAERRRSNKGSKEKKER